MCRPRKAKVLTWQSRRSRPCGSVEGIARSVAVVAGLTILSRVLGLVRTLVSSQTVGASCLGTAYVTANQVPDLLYQLILGGALTSAMVPVLARSAEQRPVTRRRRRGSADHLGAADLDRRHRGAAGPGHRGGRRADRLAAEPHNPNAHCVHADVVAVTRDMLRVFAPQALLYGLSVVLYGLLQPYRRFAAPSIGPGISSLVLIACYLAFVPLNKGHPLAQLPLTAELVLSVGTTLGIAALVVVAMPPTWRLHLRFRPSGSARGGAPGGRPGAGRRDRARRHRHGQRGDHRAGQRARQDRRDRHLQLRLSGVQLHLRDLGPVHRGQRVPVLSAREGPDFDRTSAGSTRAVLLMSWLGTAVIAAIAVPAAHVLAKRPDQVSQLT